MPRETLQTFLIRHRFSPWEIVPLANGISREDYALLRLFPGNLVLFGRLFDEQLLELSRSFCLAEYMAVSATNQPEEFAQMVSSVGREAWSFALRFSPYHKVSAALENLRLVQDAMLEAGLSLNAAKAGMESAMSFPHSDTRSYEREESKATINLLNFSALYATYIDICRRLRRYSGLAESPAYNRAIKKIIAKNVGKHDFVKDLRNFILHHHLLRPSVIITHGEVRTAALLIKSDSLVIDGYKWKSEARGFIQSNREIELTVLTTDISKDIARLVEFHEKLVGQYLKREKTAYELYKYERAKADHLVKSVTNIEAIFKLRRLSLLSKIVDKKLLEKVLTSSLTDDEVREIIALFANRHKNLAPEMKASVDREITKLLRTRPKFPITKAYIGGRQFPRKSSEVRPLPD
ncbi:MAG: hypothetical protein CTR54_11845 [Rhizobium sp.]|nr:MAG: hypothetical protein CTR54_11845 [Rhizobium sp.]